MVLVLRGFQLLGISIGLQFILGLMTIVLTLLMLFAFQHLLNFLLILRVELVDGRGYGLHRCPVLLSNCFDRDIIRLLFPQFLICIQIFECAVLIV